MRGNAPYFSSEEYQTKHINDDRGPEILASIITLAVMATLAVTLRLACRRYTKIAMAWDDYIIILGLVREEHGVW